MGSGWGYPHTPAGESFAVTKAAQALAEAVRRWNRTRVVRDEERVVDALRAYDNAVARTAGR